MQARVASDRKKRWNRLGTVGVLTQYYSTLSFGKKYNFTVLFMITSFTSFKFEIAPDLCALPCRSSFSLIVILRKPAWHSANFSFGCVLMAEIFVYLCLWNLAFLCYFCLALSCVDQCDFLLCVDVVCHITIYLSCCPFGKYAESLILCFLC